MQIENVAGICLATWWTTKQQRKFAVRNGLLRQIVIDAEHMLRSGIRRVFALPHKIFAHRTSGVRSDVLHRRGRCSACIDDDGVIHRAIFLQHINNTCDSRIFLTDCNIDAHDCIGSSPILSLIDDAIQADGCLASLAIADDQFALTTTHGNHRIDGLDAELHRFLHWLTRCDSRSDDVDLSSFSCSQRSSTIEWLAQWIHHASKKLRTNRNFQKSSSRTNGIAFANASCIAEKRSTDCVRFQVHHLAHDRSTL